MFLHTDKLGKVAITIEEDYWSNDKDYDKLTIVEKEGLFGTFISRKPVPAGTPLTDRKFWIPFSSLKEEIVVAFNELVSDLNETKEIIDEKEANLYAAIRSVIAGGVALKQEFGDDEEYGISQKVLTEFKEDIEEDISNINDIIGEDEVEGTLKGRIGALENSDITINQRIIEESNRAKTAEAALTNGIEGLTQSNIIIGALPQSGAANTIYRVPGENSYKDYAWNGSSFTELAEYDNAIDDIPTTESNNLVKSGGVFATIKPLQEALTSWNELTITDYIRNVNLERSEVWVSDSTYKSAIIPIPADAKTIRLKSTTFATTYAFLTDDDTTAGVTPNYCENCTKTNLSQDIDIEREKPEDCTYLFLYVSSNKASTLQVFYKGAVKEEIEELSSLKLRQLIIDESEYPTVSAGDSWRNKVLFTAPIGGMYNIVIKQNEGNTIPEKYADVTKAYKTFSLGRRGSVTAELVTLAKNQPEGKEFLYRDVVELEENDYIVIGDRIVGTFNVIISCVGRLSSKYIYGKVSNINKLDVTTDIIDDDEYPTIALKEKFKVTRLFMAVSSGFYHITIKNNVGNTIPEPYSDVSKVYTTFQINREGSVYTRLSEMIRNVPLTLTTLYDNTLELEAGDYITIGDRIEGSYQVQVHYEGSISSSYIYDKLSYLETEPWRVADNYSDKYRHVSIHTLNTQRVTFGFFSDLHKSVDGLSKIVQYYNTYKDVYLENGDMIFGGDLPSSIYTEDISMWTNTEETENFLYCIGNHEFQISGAARTEYIGLPCYNKYIKPNINNWGVLGFASVEDDALVYDENNPENANIFQPSDAETNGRCYYFKDYSVSSTKLRLITLDFSDYGSHQKSWFTAVLADANTNGYSVVVMAHMPSARIKKLHNNFDSPTGSDYIYSMSSGWHSVFTEWKAHEEIQDFIDNGGKFVTWLCGHLHRDSFGVIDGYDDQTVISITCAAIQHSRNSIGYESDMITTTESAMDLISIDVVAGILYIQRIGTKETIYGKNRISLAWDYKNKVVVRET